MRQSPQGTSYDIFGKCFELEYTSVDMTHMPHVHSNISITAMLGIINNQFYKFLRLCVSKDFLVSQMVSLIVFLKNKGYLTFVQEE
jgi:tRNA-dihydrouridine synthase